MEDVLEQQRILYGKLPISVQLLYWTLLLLVFVTIVSSCFIELDVVVNARGVVRPAQEKTIVRSGMNGFLDSLFVAEGQLIRRNDRIARLRDDRNQATLERTKADNERLSLLVADLALLTGMKTSVVSDPGKLRTALYREQLLQFLQKQEESRVSMELAHKKLKDAEQLAAEKIIAPAELKQAMADYRRLKNSYEAYRHQQIAYWNQDYLRLQQEYSELNKQLIQLAATKREFELRAPVSGIVQGMTGLYSNSSILAGEPICTVSPEDTLIAECFVKPSEIGFMKEGQPVSYSVETFDPKQFGKLKGKIIAIDKDLSVNQEVPVFKIRSSIHAQALSLKNGYQGKIRKGMSLQLRFFIARRTVWQLVFDNLQNWLDPAFSV